MKDFAGNNIPKLGFGLMRLPTLGDETKIDIEHVKKMVDHYMQAGFTYFDTAYVYHGGFSEKAAKQALVERYERSKFQLATKLPLWDVQPGDDQQKVMQELFDTSLERTGAGYFDYYLLHSLSRSMFDKLEKLGAWDFGKQLKTKGLVKNFGFSYHDDAQGLDELLTKHPDVDFVQLQINYIDWESDSVQSRLCYEVAMKHNIPVIIMEPIRGGSLANMSTQAQEMFKSYNPNLSIASWAMRYCASLEGIITVLSGISNMEQVEDNVSYMKEFKPLDQGERNVVDKVVAYLNSLPVVPCTACRYCTPDCPMNIDIAEIFKVYNEHLLYRNTAKDKERYQRITAEGGKAGDCIECGSCEGHCPQHISIIEELKKVAAALE